MLNVLPALGKIVIGSSRSQNKAFGVGTNNVTTRLLSRSLRLDASNDAGVVDKVVEELVPLGG
jgi:hypothetical protein